MANPYHHSVSSVKLFGGSVEDYQALHTFFDESKSHHPDFRHRSLRHHERGIELAVQLFGEHLPLSNGGCVPVREVGSQHMREDIGHTPSLSDWYESMAPQPWMNHAGPLLMKLGSAAEDAETVAQAAAEGSAAKWGGREGDYLPLLRWFTACQTWTGDFRARGALYHSEGIFLSERIFGPTLVTQTGRKVPTRWVGERHVSEVLGKIPTVSDWVRSILPQPWMRRIGVKVEEDPEIQRIEAEMSRAGLTLVPVTA